MSNAAETLIQIAVQVFAVDGRWIQYSDVDGMIALATETTFEHAVEEARHALLRHDSDFAREVFFAQLNR